MLYIANSRKTIRHNFSACPLHHILLRVEQDSLELLGIAEDEACGVAGESVHSAFSGRKVVCSELYKLALEDLWGKQDWKDACFWGIGSNGFMQPYFLFNALADSFPTRRNIMDSRAFMPVVSLVKFAAPFTEAGFEDMTFFALRPHPDSLIISNLETMEVAHSEYFAKIWEALPSLEIEGPEEVASEMAVTLSVRAKYQGEPLEHPLDVELEHVNGYLPKTRVRLNGVARFNVMALGLAAGEKIKIKAGFRYAGSLAEKTLRVI